IPPSWSRSCPVEGVCSECGLDFAWGDVLNPQLTIPAWLIENEARRGLRLIPALIRTTWRATFPLRFWKQVRLVHPVLLRRLLLVTLWLCLLLYTAAALTIFLRNLYPNAWAPALDLSVTNLVGGLKRGLTWPRMIVRPVLIAPLLVWLLTPMGFFALSTSMNLARVRWVHVCRATIYGLIGLTVWSLLALVVDFGMYAAYLLNPSLWDVFTARDGLRPFWGLGCVLWTCYWWSVVTARYMRLHLWWAVTFSLCAISILTTLVVLAYWDLF
ncbi:MAG: hypothetical protein KDA21_12000, partial [Phycisphaerales bacterium]|nr:hypothetical protein [Phycisphaerales bacterium]